MLYTFKPRPQTAHDIASFAGARIEPLTDGPGTLTVRLPNGERLSVYADEIVEHDRDFDLDAMIDGYVEAALWADYMDPDRGPDGETGGGDGLGLEPDDESKARVRETCESFFNFNAADCLAYCEWRGFDSSQGSVESYMGHDLWLDSHGHGCGFWDRGLGALGDRLSEAAKPHATSMGVVMDNGDGTVEIL